MTASAEAGFLHLHTVFGSIPAAREHGVDSRVVKWTKNNFVCYITGNHKLTGVSVVVLDLMAQRTAYAFACMVLLLSRIEAEKTICIETGVCLMRMGMPHGRMTCRAGVFDQA